jgi:hypothetical protein
LSQFDPKASRNFTDTVVLNQCCLTVAKRLEILQVNKKIPRLFFADRKNIKNSAIGEQ